MLYTELLTHMTVYGPFDRNGEVILHPAGLGSGYRPIDSLTIHAALDSGECASLVRVYFAATAPRPPRRNSRTTAFLSQRAPPANEIMDRKAQKDAQIRIEKAFYHS